MIQILTTYKKINAFLITQRRASNHNRDGEFYWKWSKGQEYTAKTNNQLTYENYYLNKWKLNTKKYLC